MQGKKVFWHVILHSCATGCVSFSSKLKAINDFQNHSGIESTLPSNKLFCYVILNDSLCSVSWKFFMKIESTWRREIKEQPPQLIFLYRGRTVRSSHRRCCIWKLFLKLFAISAGNTCVGVLFFKKLQTFRPATLWKRNPGIGVFLWILQNFYYYLFWKIFANGCFLIFSVVHSYMISEFLF